jgi:hypothetical protein
MTQINVFQKEPNVYITEAATPPSNPSGGPLGVGAMFGVAEWGPVGIATLVEGMADFERIFGKYISTTYPMHRQAKKFFENGGRSLYITRVVHYTTITDPSTKTSAQAIATLVDGSAAARIIVQGKYDGAKGNRVSIVCEDPSLAITNEFKMTVRLDGAAIEPPYDNLSLDATANNYFRKVVNNLSDWVYLSEGTSIAALSIAANTLVTLVSGTNGLTTLGTTDYIGDASAQNGIKAFNVIDDCLLVACPDADVTTDVTVRKEIGRWVDNDRVLNFGIHCVPASLAAIAAASFVTSTLALDSPRSAIYFPFLKDQDTGEYIAPTGAVMGVFARFANDANKGPWWSPAGTEAFLYGVAGVEFRLASDSAGKLNEKSINVIKIMPSGPTIWGGRTLAIAKAADFRYIGARLNTSNIEYLIAKNTQWAVNRPNDAGLWEQISQTVRRILLQRWRDGGFDGKLKTDAFSLVCDGTVNTQAQKVSGVVVCQIGIRNKQTAEFIWFNIAQLGTGAEITE